MESYQEMPLSEKEEPKAQKAKESSAPTKLSYKEQRALETLPIQIQALEDEIASIKKCLEDPECYQKIGLSKLSQNLEEKEALLEPMIEELLEIEEKVEMMQRG